MISPLGRLFQHTCIRVHERIVIKEGFHILFRHRGTPLCGKGPLLQADGIKSDHPAQMIIIGKGYRKNRKIAFQPAVKQRLPRQIKRHHTIILNSNALLLQKIRHKFVSGISQLRYIPGLVIEGSYPYIKNRSFLQIS